MNEQWKLVKIDSPFAENRKLEVSSLGRIRIRNKYDDDYHLLKGSLQLEYPIIRLKFFKPRDSSVQLLLDKMEKTKQGYDAKREFTKAMHLAVEIKKVREDDCKARTVNVHYFIHRLVAEYFLTRPSMAHSVVAHRDYDKSNNSKYNLAWQTPEQNYEHQQNNPAQNLQGKAKLTETKVLMIKKLLGEGKGAKMISKSFGVTDTQIHRIRTGENWGSIRVAK